MSTKSIQEVESYWNNRPCNIRHSDKEIGTEDYFNEVEKRKYMVEPHIPAFADFPKWKGKKVLEIGCGIGTDAVNFVRAGADYTGVELSEKSLSITKQRFDIFKLKGQFYLADSEELSKILPQQKFDLIYSFGVIHHTPKPRNVINQIINNTSELRIMLYTKNSWKSFMIECGLDQPEAQSGCPIAYTYTEADIIKLLPEFEILDMHQDHIFPYQISKYVNYEYELQPWFQAMPEKMFKTLEKKLGWHLLIKAKLK